MRSALAVLVSIPVLAASSLAWASVLVLYPAADTHVRSDHPSTNYGADGTLYIDTAPDERRSFLRFEIAGVSGTVTSATLRVFVVDAGDGGNVYTTTASPSTPSRPDRWSTTSTSPPARGSWPCGRRTTSTRGASTP